MDISTAINLHVSNIINKHATESEWLDHPDFIPMKAETIIYDSDENHRYQRMKIGDGITTINELPFIGNAIQMTETKPRFACRWFIPKESETVNPTAVLGEAILGQLILE